jgi:CubicO group peptidase (beta-lactamase class C family)
MKTAYLLLGLWATAQRGSCADATLDKATIQRIEELVIGAMSTDSIPGLTISVAVGGKPVLSRAFGLQDVENVVPARNQTVFRLASVSKPISAVLALRLAQAGRLDLDAPVQRYVPAFPARHGLITSRLLLAHLSGIRHYRNYGEINSKTSYASLTHAMGIFQDDPLVAPPGSRFAYTTFGYTLLGAVLEAACGAGFKTCLKQWVLAPAGLDRIAVDEVHTLIPNRSRGYGKDRSGHIINTDLLDTSNRVPGGGLAGTASELVRFALAVRDGSLLEPEMRDAMWRSQRQADGASTGYGLGWFLWKERPGTVGHGGGQAGATSILLVEPASGAVVAVLSNMEQARCVEELAERVLTLVTKSAQ